MGGKPATRTRSCAASPLRQHSSAQASYWGLAVSLKLPAQVPMQAGTSELHRRWPWGRGRGGMKGEQQLAIGSFTCTHCITTTSVQAGVSRTLHTEARACAQARAHLHVLCPVESERLLTRVTDEGPGVRLDEARRGVKV